MKALSILLPLICLLGNLLAQTNNNSEINKLYRNQIFDPHSLYQIEPGSKTLLVRPVVLKGKIFSPRKATNNIQSLPDSLIVKSIIVNQPDYKFIFKHDKLGRLTEYVNQSKHENHWETRGRTQYYYAKGLLTEIVSYSKVDTGYVESRISHYFYDEEDRVSEIIDQFFNDGWNNMYWIKYVYDEKGNLKNIVTKYYDMDEWVNSAKYFYFYNDFNERDSLILQLWEEDKWRDRYKAFFTNEGDTKIATVFSINSGTSDLYYRRTEQVVNGKLYTIYQNYMLVSWQNENRNISEFTEDGFLISSYNEGWSNGSWLPSVYTTVVSNPDGFELGFLDATSIEAYFSEISGVEEKTYVTPESYSLFQNYPNPFNPVTTIKFELPVGDYVSVKVYDMLGRVVDEAAAGEFSQGVHTLQFDGAGLSSGVYFYTMQTGSGFTDTKKLILMK